MVRTNLIHRFALGAWAMEPTRAQAFMPVVSRIIRGESIEGVDRRTYWDAPEYTPEQRAQMMGIRFLDEHNNPIDTFEQKIGPEVRGLVAVLPMREVILKYDESCGPTGMETVAEWHRRYDADPRVAAIVLDMDTPGGEGSGMTLMADRLAKRTKTVVTSVNSGMCASAGYGIAAATDRVFASRDTDEFGSIGTYVTLMDWKAFYAKEGLPIHEIYATRSEEKNRDFREALDGNYELIRQRYIDPFNEAFLAHVVENREKVTNDSEALKGRLYYAKDAKKLGLVDGMADLQGAADAARKMATKGERSMSTGSTASAQSESHTNTTTPMLKSFFGTSKDSALARLAEVPVAEVTNEMLAAANAELTEAGVHAFLMPGSEGVSSAAEMQTMLDGLNGQLATLRDQLTERDAEVARLQESLSEAQAAQAERQSGIDAATAAMDAALTEAGAAPVEGEPRLTTVLNVLKSTRTDLAQAKDRITELERTDTDEGKGAGLRNEEGDVRTPQPETELDRFTKEATEELKSMRRR